MAPAGEVIFLQLTTDSAEEQSLKNRKDSDLQVYYSKSDPTPREEEQLSVYPAKHVAGWFPHTLLDLFEHHNLDRYIEAVSRLDAWADSAQQGVFVNDGNDAAAAAASASSAKAKDGGVAIAEGCHEARNALEGEAPIRVIYGKSNPYIRLKPGRMERSFDVKESKPKAVYFRIKFNGKLTISQINDVAAAGWRLQRPKPVKTTIHHYRADAIESGRAELYEGSKWRAKNFKATLHVEHGDIVRIAMAHPSRGKVKYTLEAVEDN